MAGARSDTQTGELAPVESRFLWVFWGLILQAVGVGIPLAIGYVRGHREGVGGHITLATVRLIWHQMVKDHHVLPWIVLGVVIFVIGAVVIARPFCRRRLTLLLAVPLGALAGVVILGAVALIIACIWVSLDSLVDPSGWGGGSKKKKKKKKTSGQPGGDGPAGQS